MPFAPPFRAKVLRNFISAGSAGFSHSGLCRPCGICPGFRLLWMSKRSSHASTEYKRQWRSPLGNYEKVWWSRSLTSLSFSSQLDPAVGRPLFRIISLIFCSTVTFRETARRWRETHLAPVWAGWASMRTEKNTCGLNSTLQSPSDKAFFRI